MSQSSVCVSVTGENLKIFLENLEQIQQKVDIIELRCDYIKDFRIECLDIIYSTINDFQSQKLGKNSKKYIFTCRKVKDGGKFEGTLESWQKITEKALQMGFDYIDLEFGSSLKKLDFSSKHPQTKLILSLHDFYETPGYRHLRNIQKNMRPFNPHAMKFACFVKTERDNQNLTRLLVSSKKNDKMIVIGMGEKGRKIRIINALLGNYINFVGLDGQTSAPGQWELEEFETMIEKLS